MGVWETNFDYTSKTPQSLQKLSMLQTTKEMEHEQSLILIPIKEWLKVCYGWTYHGVTFFFGSIYTNSAYNIGKESEKQILWLHWYWLGTDC